MSGGSVLFHILRVNIIRAYLHALKRIAGAVILLDDIVLDADPSGKLDYRVEIDISLPDLGDEGLVKLMDAHVLEVQDIDPPVQLLHPLEDISAAVLNPVGVERERGRDRVESIDEDVHHTPALELSELDRMVMVGESEAVPVDLRGKLIGKPDELLERRKALAVFRAHSADADEFRTELIVYFHRAVGIFDKIVEAAVRSADAEPDLMTELRKAVIVLGIGGLPLGIAELKELFKRIPGRFFVGHQASDRVELQTEFFYHFYFITISDSSHLSGAS